MNNFFFQLLIRSWFWASLCADEQRLLDSNGTNFDILNRFKSCQVHPGPVRLWKIAWKTACAQPTNSFLRTAMSCTPGNSRFESTLKIIKCRFEGFHLPPPFEPFQLVGGKAWRDKWSWEMKGEISRCRAYRLQSFSAKTIKKSGLLNSNLHLEWCALNVFFCNSHFVSL